MTNRFHGSLFCRATVAAASVVGVLAVAQISPAQTYVCPPAPEGVYGLPGGPKFAESPLPDTFASQLDDPRWNGSWREDFLTGSATEAGVRMLKEGNNLFVSFEAKVDPDGAGGLGSSDQVFLGFSADGIKAQMVRIAMTASPPQRNQPAVTTVQWWQTTDGGATPWQQQPPGLSWATASNIHLWSGGPPTYDLNTGTGNGDSWAINAKLDLTAIAASLGGGASLSGPFRMWYEIDVDTPAFGTIQYAWPPGSAVTLTVDPMHAGQLLANLGVSTFGNAYPTVASNCPSGISLDFMHIGTRPFVSPDIPGSLTHFGAGHPGNDFVAVMDNGGAPIADGSVKARFRIANWGSMIGVGGDWKDLIPSPGMGVPGTQTNLGKYIDFLCVNPGGVGTLCYQPPPTVLDQCLLVELSQATGSGLKFLHDSARRNLDFVNASTFERVAEISVRGLTPLAGSTGQRDVYLYVRAVNMPDKANGNPPIQIPPPVPPLPSRKQAAEGPPPQPRYRMTDYERYTSVMPTYEVHVYHDTGRTKAENGHTYKMLEPQAPFGYLVTHQGDLEGWTKELTGEGFVLEQIAPNFYRAHVPDNGSVQVHTKIIAREPPPCVQKIRCSCDVVRSEGWSPLALGVAGLGATLLVVRARRRKGDRSTETRN